MASTTVSMFCMVPPSGVVLARCSERASTTPLGVVVRGGELYCMSPTSSTMPARSLRELCSRASSSSSCVVSPTLIFFLLTLPPVHGVYDVDTDPLGSCVRDPATEQSTTSTTPACCAWSPSGVALARSLAAAVVQRQHGSLRSCVRESTSSTTPAWSLGVVSAVVVVMRHFTPTLI